MFIFTYREHHLLTITITGHHLHNPMKRLMGEFILLTFIFSFLLLRYLSIIHSFIHPLSLIVSLVHSFSFLFCFCFLFFWSSVEYSNPSQTIVEKSNFQILVFLKLRRNSERSKGYRVFDLTKVDSTWINCIVFNHFSNLFQIFFGKISQRKAYVRQSLWYVRRWGKVLFESHSYSPDNPWWRDWSLSLSLEALSSFLYFLSLVYRGTFSFQKKLERENSYFSIKNHNHKNNLFILCL